MKKIPDINQQTDYKVLVPINSKQSVEPNEHIEIVSVSPEVNAELDVIVTSPSEVVAVDVTITDTKYKDLNSN